MRMVRPWDHLQFHDKNLGITNSGSQCLPLVGDLPNMAWLKDPGKW